MAAVDFSGVLELCKKAVVATKGGRWASAVDYYSRAAEAARALVLPADSLIHAHLGVQLAGVLGMQSQMAGVEPAAALPLALRELSVLEAVMPVLLRRRADCDISCAGRTAEEEAYACAFSELDLKIRGPVGPVASVQRKALTYTVFYLAYVTAAERLLKAEFHLSHVEPAAFLPEVMLPFPERLCARYDFAASALDFVNELGQFFMDRSVEHSCYQQETLLVSAVRACEALYASMKPAYITEKLLAAWRRLQSSGVLAQHDLDAQNEEIRLQNASIRAALAAQASERGLRTCQLTGCAARELHVSHFKRCGACKAAVYCCREHQLADWPSHKAACKAARKAAADSTQTA